MSFRIPSNTELACPKTFAVHPTIAASQDHRPSHTLSELAESLELTKHFNENPFDLTHIDEAQINRDLGPDFIDPQYIIPYPSHLHESALNLCSRNSPFIWDTPADGSLLLLENAAPSHDDGADLTAMAAPLDTSSPLSAANLSSRRTSKSSVPSLPSTSKPRKKRVRKPSQNKQGQKVLSSMIPVQIEKELILAGEKDAGRTKHLERNRAAASKCRQKKKKWVHELGENKAEMEGKHIELQREHGVLLGEVSMIKNLLMRHAGCKDPNIDHWIGLEAKKFV